MEKKNNKNKLVVKTVPRYTLNLINPEWHAGIINFLVGILMIAIYCWLFGGGYCSIDRTVP